MKSKEYADKYRALENPNITDKEYVSCVKNLFHEMFDEFMDLSAKRHIKTRAGQDALLREMNDKGNKISNLLGDAMKKDWFLILVKSIERKVKEE